MRYRWKTAGRKALGVLLLCAFLSCTGCRDGGVVYDSGEAGEEAGPDVTEGGLEEETGEEACEPPVFVYVCGEVAVPGVYELPAGARIVDAIQEAGGMTEEASDTYLNLAEPVKDGQKIEVPDRERARELLEAESSKASGLVNLNTATAEELMTLTGIGESKAAAILAYREEHGGFQTPEELMEIPGIKEGVFQKIRDQITV